jgi:hypothetical protein
MVAHGGAHNDTICTVETYCPAAHLPLSDAVYPAGERVTG